MPLQVVDDLVGVPIATASSIAAISVRRLRSWHDEGLVLPAVDRMLGPGTRIRLYAFDQLVEMCVIRELEDRGQDIRHIRFVTARHENDGIARPLLELRWGVDGGHMYAQHSDGTWTGGRRHNQAVITDVIDIDLIRATVRSRLEERGKESVGRVERRRGVQGSRPVFAGTRTPVATVQQYLRRGLSQAEILEAFPHLTAADVDLARGLLAG